MVISLLSLITCSRDPDDVGLEAMLASVRALRVPRGWRVEHVIVDNGSESPLAARPSVRSHLALFPNARLSEDRTEGLAAVRARVLRASAGELLVTVDDDNLPESGYLEALVTAAAELPDVGIFGAGRIAVVLPADAPAWASDPWVLRLFQERDFPAPTHGLSRDWQPYYPPGTGMAVRRRIAVAFAEGVERGELRNCSRRKGHLSGGEDAQLVWICVRDGLSVGTFPGMRLSHYVSPRRLSPRYIRRLVFGIHESAVPARFEVIRDESLPPFIPARALARGVRRIQLDGKSVVRWAQLAAAAGDAAALCEVNERPEPSWLRALIAQLGVR